MLGLVAPPFRGATPMCYVNKCNFDRYYNGSRFMDGLRGVFFFLSSYTTSMVRRNRQVMMAYLPCNRTGLLGLVEFRVLT